MSSLQANRNSQMAMLNPARKFVVYPGSETYRMFEEIEAISLAGLAAKFGEAE